MDLAFTVSYTVDNEQQFWNELDEIVSVPCTSHALIDNALRTFLGFTTSHKTQFLTSEEDVFRCSYTLFTSSIFAAHTDYVRRQIIYGLLQEDEPDILHFLASFLLFDGRQNEAALEMMNEEGSFPRLLELIQSRNFDDEEGEGPGGAGLHRLFIELLYEMSRIQRIKIEDLVLVDDEFIKLLFQIIEELSNDANDPYHYPVIRVLLVLNEQFMVSAHDPAPERASFTPPTNKVIKVLSMHGSAYKTFGENIILLLNRESETSLQLLTLKLLYLLFTTQSTYEYFYTNDLRVLVDILIRNLLDLPEEAAALRHTYLRVMYPLLAHTQLQYPPHYKREEVKKLLGILVRGQFSGGEEGAERIMHFEDVDDTTKRLVARCAKVDWLCNPQLEPGASSPGAETTGTMTADDACTASPTTAVREESAVAETDTPSTASSTYPNSPDSESVLAFTEQRSSQAPTLDPKTAYTLGMDLEPARSSTHSVLEVVTQREKPGVITPSRWDNAASTDAGTGPSVHAGKPKIKPEPPKTRRWRGKRAKEEDEGGGKAEGAATAIQNMGADEEASPISIPGAGIPDTPTSTSGSGSLPFAQERPHLQPPALPPPRRSSHSVSPSQKTNPHHVQALETPSPTLRVAVPSAAAKENDALPDGSGNGAVQSRGHGPKPEPPKARRWHVRIRRAQEQGEQQQQRREQDHGSAMSANAPGHGTGETRTLRSFSLPETGGKEPGLAPEPETPEESGYASTGAGTGVTVVQDGITKIDLEV